MFSFLKKNPKAKLMKEYEEKLKQAMDAQRKGDIKAYSMLNEEADKILQKADAQG